MKKFAIFIFLCSVQLNWGCVETYDSSVTEKQYVFRYYEEFCNIEILPVNGSFITVTITSRHKKFIVYEIFNGSNNTQEKIWKGETSGDNIFWFTSSPETGLFIETVNSAYHYDDPTVEVKITKQGDQVFCDPIEVFLNDTAPRVIQSNRANKCPHRLILDPLRANFSDTLYIYSYYSTIYSAKKKEDNLIVLPNWNQTDIVSTVKPNNNGVIPKVVALTTNRSCSCGRSEIELEDKESFTFQSPGYPDFLCPSLYCSTNFTFASSNISDAKVVRRALVTLDMKYRNGVDLKFKKEKFNLTLSYYSMSFTFLMKLDGLTELVYETPAVFPLETAGHFQINLTNLYIEKECDCSTFMSKLPYSINNRSVTVTIPSKCELVYCEWNIEASDYNPIRQVIIDINSVGNHDEVAVMTSTKLINYNSYELLFPRKLIIPDCNKNAHISYWRKGFGEETTVTVSWEPFSINHCDSVKHAFISEVPQSFISPNYPGAYSTGHDCEFILEASENETITVFINNIDLEQIHDHLTFFDGKSENSKKIGHLTGVHSNVTLKSTGNFIFVRFHTDIEVGNMGYHFVVFSSAANNKKLEIIETTSDNLTQNTSTSIWFWVLIFIVAILVILTAALVLLKKRNMLPKNAHEFSDSMVRFHSEQSGSSVTIDS